jgi:RNA polymerase sigma-B factor
LRPQRAERCGQAACRSFDRRHDDGKELFAVHIDELRSNRMSDETAAGLIQEYRRTGDVRIRNRVVEAHAWLAQVRARRLMRRSESLDDLVQVASIGVLKAVERFDPAFGVMFRSFASITVDGELRRYYRSSWRVRVPRSTQELVLEIAAATEHLSAVNRAAPSIEDIARYLERPVKEVEQAMIAGQNHRPGSLDQGMEDAGDANAPVMIDPGFDLVFDRSVIEQLLDTLPPRSRRMVQMRFEAAMTQAEIAAEFGVSQVHVSRLLSGALSTMRNAAQRDLATAS